MLSINQILSEIKEGNKVNVSSFTVYYEDRLLNQLVGIKFSDILRIENDAFMIIKKQVDHHSDKDIFNSEVIIPLHRIKSIKYKDTPLWKRKINFTLQV